MSEDPRVQPGDEVVYVPPQDGHTGTPVCELGDHTVHLNMSRQDIHTDGFGAYLILLELEKHRETLHAWANEFVAKGGRYSTIDEWLAYGRAYWAARSRGEEH